MKPIVIKINREPVPWAAATVTRKGAFDKKSKVKEAIIWEMKTQCKPLNLACPLRVDFYFGMPIPASISKKKRELMIWAAIPHIIKPDLDNLRKLTSDCLERAKIIRNDSIIVCGESKKFYAEKPHTMIIIYSLEDDDATEEREIQTDNIKEYIDRSARWKATKTSRSDSTEQSSRVRRKDSKEA